MMEPSPQVAHSEDASLPCPWLCLDARGAVVASNAALCRLLGLSQEALHGKAFDSLMSAASRVLYQSYLQPLLRLHGNIEEILLTLKTSAGDAIDVLLYTSRRSLDEGHLIEVVLAPIRQRRRIEDELQRIKRAADQAPGLIFQLMQQQDGRMQFPFASEAIRRLYGVTPEEATGSAELAFRHVMVDDLAGLHAALKGSALTGAECRVAYRVALPGHESRWHEMQATPRRLANGVVLWHGHIGDITLRRELEATLAERETLERVHQVRSEFLSRVSHELRTPLNGILGFAQLLAIDSVDALSARQRDRVEVIQSSGRHLLQLINQVLEVTRIESGQLDVDIQECDLELHIHRALRLVEPLAEAAGVTLLACEGAHGVKVKANDLRLDQVLVNLLSNAIKYNRPGGSVKVLVEVPPHAEPVRIQVSDTGLGISQAHMAELFQPFHRLGAQHSQVEGTGLGLVITRHLLALMGGSIEVSSELGVGSVFTVGLPPCHAAHDGSHSRPTVVLPLDHSTEQAEVQPCNPLDAEPAAVMPCGTVLYVEDNPINAILMEAICGLGKGIELHVTPDGASALEFAKRQPPDLFLLDMHLPDTDGISLLAALRAIDGLQHVPAVMVSAAARSDDIEHARRGGFQSYWTKPLDVDLTLGEIERLLTMAKVQCCLKQH
jgi:PAS domain S-box-containing protein